MSISIETKVKTCSCGMVYLVPDWMYYRSECPACASRRIVELEGLYDEMERTNSSLRGVITRLRNAAKKKESA